MGIIIWAVTRVGNIAIFFAILADGFAAIPTLIKSYKEPQTENSTVFGGGIINAGLALFSISIWNFKYYAFPLYLLVINTMLYLLIQFKLGKFFSKKNAQLF